jgi:large subunit ribosomal protein L22
MSVNAKITYLRIAPRKVRLIADMIRGKKASEAKNALLFTTNKSAAVILKLLNQAIDSAKNNFQMDERDLYISKITVDGGPILKRFRPRARGSAFAIQKKTSHITLTLDGLGNKAGKKTKGPALKEDNLSPKEADSVKSEETKKAAKPKIKSEKEISKHQIETGKRKIFRRQTF